MARQDLRAPAEDGGLLALPPLVDGLTRLEANRRFLASWDHDFQGRRAGRLRTMVRAQVLALSKNHLARFGLDGAPFADPSAPLVVTGHQPELSHPGVWVKNFAIASIAERCGGTALNLIVDNDLPKGASIRVPCEDDGPLRARAVDFDDWVGEVPFEDLSVRDESLFASFGDRVGKALGRLVADPLIHEFWPLALRAGERTPLTGMRFAVARRALEGSWGVRNAEVPLSAVCESEGFLWFASHLLAHLPRFQTLHNEALARYRVEHGIRSRNHPVPALGSEGDWLEAPFWVWRDRSPRRRPLLARQQGEMMDLRIAGEAETLIRIPLAPDRDACCAVRDLQGLPARGVRLRTRALTTTMFARLLLGDVFLHGIGGAKYDELGDEVARCFFEIEPPPFLTLSMTLRLGLDADPEAPSRLKALDRRLRDLTFNPDRNFAGVARPGFLQLAEAKRRAIAAPQGDHAERVARFRHIRGLNQEMQADLGGMRAALLGNRTGLTAAIQRQALARNREYSLVLHSKASLRRAMAQAVPGVFS